MKFSFAIIVILFRLCHGDDCYFPHNLAAKEKGEFGSNLTYADTPCLIWFTSTLPGALRLDFNNKIFASKKEKKSCLSEYIKVQNGDATWKLCHSNVTTPVQIGVPGQSGHVDATSPVIALVRWVGSLDKSTSYLGKYDFVPLPSVAKSGKVEGNALAEIITDKLDLFLRQRNKEQGGLQLGSYHYLTAEECDSQQWVLCQHSRFCAEDITGLGCNRSLFMCIPSQLGCNGELNCLEGDASDETGCFLPYVLFTTGGVVLTLTLVASAACLFQHHNMLLKNGMTRYNCDLVRRKDKVKARKAEGSSAPTGSTQQQGPSTISLPTPSRPPSSVPSGSTLRAHQTRDNPSEASYYQAAPSKEPPFQPPRASPSQKLPEAPWPNPQPSILASAPQKPQSQLINPTSSQPERSTAAIEEGLTHLGSIHGGSSHVNTTQGRAFSSTQLRAENGSSLPQATNGKSKIGGGGTDCNGGQEEEEERLVSEQVQEQVALLAAGEEVRRPRKILADEREILREQRIAGFAAAGEQRRSVSSSEQWSQCDLDCPEEETKGNLGNYKHNGSVHSCDQLERRRRRHTGDSMDGLTDSAKSSYGYRFDFRSSCEFEFTEDAYI